MRIALISSIYKATPPSGYGGIERVVHALAEELVRQGHEVTLFAARGSWCSGTTIELTEYDPATAPSGIVKAGDALSEEGLRDAMAAHLREHPVDVIHDWSFQNLFIDQHRDAVPFVISSCVPPSPGFARQNLVACSAAHAALFGRDTPFVHYGLDLAKWEWSTEKHSPPIHIAKIAPYKGQHIAILAARRARVPLQLAGNVENRLYFWSRVKPLLWLTPTVDYIGELAGTADHLREAAALVQAPRWFEAFPFVGLEAAASGTPIVALAEGGVVEQVSHGTNGFLCQNVSDLAEALKEVGSISPAACRDYAEAHFSVERMVREYVGLYERAIAGERW